METLEYHTVDKATWPDGPWKQEPDKMQWPDEATGLPCLIVRNRLGALCGYVGVTREHPAYEKHYDAVYEMANIDVHGGLTFSDKCSPGKEETGICHKPGKGDPDDVWWLGFDCAHICDLVPLMPSDFKDEWATYRDVPYVKKQCAILAAQLAEKAA